MAISNSGFYPGCSVFLITSDIWGSAVSLSHMKISLIRKSYSQPQLEICVETLLCEERAAPVWFEYSQSTFPSEGARGAPRSPGPIQICHSTLALSLNTGLITPALGMHLFAFSLNLSWVPGKDNPGAENVMLTINSLQKK